MQKLWSIGIKKVGLGNPYIIRLLASRAMDLSDDVWNVIFAHLDVKARANVASVNKRLSTLFATWLDVTMLSLKDGTICIAGDTFKHVTKCNLKTVLKHCPNVNEITIQSIQNEKCLRQLATVEHLNCLTAATSLINSITVSCLGVLCSARLRKLRILQRYDELKTIRNVLRQSQLTQICTAPLVSLQLSGVVLKPDVFTNLCDSLKPTLTELLISGALCNPPDFDQYITAIGTLSHLKALDIPPSLFSCCHRTLPSKMSTLRTLSLKKLSVYVHYYSAPNMGDFLATLPKTLKELILFRTTELDHATWSKDFEELPYKVYLCRLDDIIFEPPWMCDRYELLTHTLWLPPYNFAHNFSRTDLPSEWYQEILSAVKEEEVDEQRLNSVATALQNSTAANRSEFVAASPRNPEINSSDGEGTIAPLRSSNTQSAETLSEEEARHE